MSTDSRRARTRRRRGRAFAGAFTVVLGALVVVGVAGAAVTVAQGPRVTDVQVDPRAAVAASGARVILTTTQSLRAVSPAQVEVEPHTPFTVDTSGRSVGVRFALPLRDDTDYTVRIRDVQGVGAGPAATLEERFRTPSLQMHLLQRGGGSGDTIYRTGLDGDAVPVYTHPHIEDFRATAAHLVVSVLDDDDAARLIVTDLDGGDPRELPLPGEGFVSNLQVADRGERIGFTYSDADLGADGGVESVLFTASAAEGAAGQAPTEVVLPGEDARVAEWRFVPDTDRILALTFDGRLLLAASDGADAAPLGTALGIEGIARGSAEAVIERIEGLRVVDLADGSEEPLVAPAEDVGVPGGVTPLPGEGSIRRFADISATSTVLGTRVVRVGADGAVDPLVEVGPQDAVLQTCVSPSGRYAAVLLAPDAADNAYDRYRLPLPERVETRIVEIDTGEEIVGLGGFDLSWCQVPPS